MKFLWGPLDGTEMALPEGAEQYVAGIGRIPTPRLIGNHVVPPAVGCYVYKREKLPNGTEIMRYAGEVWE